MDAATEPRFRRVMRLQQAILDQERWMEQCGGTLDGYIANYGRASDPEHSGDGGEAIFAADQAHLDSLLAKLAEATTI